MYNTNYECRYHKDDIFLDTDNVTENEKEYIRGILYREDLLNTFYINDEDEFDKFDSLLCELYKKVNSCESLCECMRMAAAGIISENEEFGLCMLFSYDLMYLTHKCICSYLENGYISENDLDNLKKSINLRLIN
jgi:hypothetical protein